MIWSDKELLEWGFSGGVQPFNVDNVNPASIDLSWSGKHKVATQCGWSELCDGDQLVLEPGRFYLMDTIEYIVMPPNAVGKLFLKSSAGRMGIEHLHAGYVDPDFSGTLTLELEIRVPWPITIKKHQRLVQLTLESMMSTPLKSYSKVGRYNGQRQPTNSKGLPE